MALTKINTAGITADAVTLTEMAGLARGKIIYGDASGDPAALTVGSNGQAIVSDGTDLSWGSAGVSSIDGLSDALVENNSIWLGNDPSGTTSTASYNVAVGTTALDAITTGDNIVAIGYNALTANTTAADNVAIGYNALNATTTSGHSVAVGSSALQLLTGAYCTAVGSTAMDAATSASASTAVGYSALGAVTTGSNNDAFGFDALFSVTSASQNCAFGSYALYTNTASNNTGMGFNVLKLTTTGASNTAVGALALTANTTASNNTAVGYAALDANTTGAQNTALGEGALGANTTASNNTAIGRQALLVNTTGFQNTALGAAAGQAITTGSYNCALGDYSLQATSTGGSNTAVGSNALYANISGTHNVTIGYQAGDNITTGDSNIIIGGNAVDAASATADNQLNIGNTIYADLSKAGIGLPISQPNLLINGGFDIWQRGTSFASASYYQWYADRWNGDAFNSANFTASKQTATTAEPFLSYFRFLRNASSTDTSKGRIGQVYESEDSQGLAGQTVTLSFYARVGANWSPATNILVSGIFIGTGTNETTSSGLGSAWTGFVIQNQDNTLTTSWVRFTHTVTLSSVTNQFGIQFTAPASVGTAGAADSWDISGIKLEVGSEATPYVATPYEETIARCQRYYQKSYNINVNPGTGSSVGSCSSLAIYSTGSQSLGARWITTMRAAPTVVIYANDGSSGYVTATSNNANIAATAGDVGDSGFQYLSGSLPNTFPNGVRFHWTAASEL